MIGWTHLSFVGIDLHPAVNQTLINRVYCFLICLFQLRYSCMMLADSGCHLFSSFCQNPAKQTGQFLCRILFILKQQKNMLLIPPEIKPASVSVFYKSFYFPVHNFIFLFTVFCLNNRQVKSDRRSTFLTAVFLKYRGKELSSPLIMTHQFSYAQILHCPYRHLRPHLL